MTISTTCSVANVATTEPSTTSHICPSIPQSKQMNREMRGHPISLHRLHAQHRSSAIGFSTALTESVWLAGRFRLRHCADSRRFHDNRNGFSAGRIKRGQRREAGERASYLAYIIERSATCKGRVYVQGSFMPGVLIRPPRSPKTYTGKPGNRSANSSLTPFRLGVALL